MLFKIRPATPTWKAEPGRRAASAACGLTLLLAFGSHAAAQATRPGVPGLPQPPRVAPIEVASLPRPAILVHEDDFSSLADPALRTSPVDRLRHIPLGNEGSPAHLRLGVNSRLRYEFFENRSFGSVPGGQSVNGTRANPYASVSWGTRARLFAALKHGDALEDAAEAPPSDVEPIDLHMAFAEVGVGDLVGLQTADVLVRVGRQELHYGSGRFFSIRDGPNVRLDYDGVLARVRLPDESVTDALAFFNVDQNGGGFDNDTDPEGGFWGGYHSRFAGAWTPRRRFAGAWTPRRPPPSSRPTPPAPRRPSLREIPRRGSAKVSGPRKCQVHSTAEAGTRSAATSAPPGLPSRPSRSLPPPTSSPRGTGPTGQGSPMRGSLPFSTPRCGSTFKRTGAFGSGVQFRARWTVSSAW